MTLSTFAAERRRLLHGARSTAPAAVGRYLLSTVRSAANPPTAVAVVDLGDRQTDGHPTVT